MVVFVDGDVPCRVERRRDVKTWLKAVALHHDCALGDLSIVACSDEELLKYNRTYLDHDTYTDIITFDQSEGKRLSGDLLISFERVSENAENQGVLFQEELRRVMVHGLLHLVGFKDKSPDDASNMRAAEDHALSLFHVEQRG
ncbi:MAG: rRNA maturation RNase YbeY [Flavobacteriales bacterium]|nr:rRNA maturation RNase YbeY [Flavobacteriales bacterium]